MRLRNFTFEQYESRGEEINAVGNAGNASIDLESGDVKMDMGVRLEVISEDIIIETWQLEWNDEQRLLFTGEEDTVNISQENGTSFTGIGLRADARRRTWEFLGAVSGTYIFEDDEEESDRIEGE
jgi:hypothetical protein